MQSVTLANSTYVYSQKVLIELKRLVQGCHSGVAEKCISRPTQNRVFPGKFDFSLGPVLFSLQMV